MLYQIAAVTSVSVLGIFVPYRFPFHLIGPEEDSRTDHYPVQVSGGGGSASDKAVTILLGGYPITIDSKRLNFGGGGGS